MVALLILFLLRSGFSCAVQVLGCFGLRQGASGVLVLNALYGLCLARYQVGRLRQHLVTFVQLSHVQIGVNMKRRNEDTKAVTGIQLQVLRFWHLLAFRFNRSSPGHCSCLAVGGGRQGVVVSWHGQLAQLSECWIFSENFFQVGLLTSSRNCRTCT